MKPTHYAISTFAGSFLLILTLQAHGEPLTWDQCVKEARMNNRDLRTAERTVKAAENSHAASFGQWFPQISLGSSLSRSGTDGSLGGALSNPLYASSANLSISAQETIFSGFRDFAAVDTADAQLDLARAQLTQAKAQLSRDLKVAFYQLLFSQQQIVLLEKIRDRDKANQDLVQMNFDGGTDNKGSLMQAQASTKQDEFAVEQARRSLRVARRQLDQVLGRDMMDDPEVEGDFDAPSLGREMPDFVKLTSQTPAHRQALARYHLSEAQDTNAQSAFFPTLTANASMEGQGASYDSLSPGWSATLAVSFPLFAGGRDFFDWMSADESKQGAKATMESTDLRTESQLESAYAAYVDAVQENKVQQFQVKTAQTREEIAKAEYLNGLLSFQNWNQLEENLTGQQKAELASYLSIKTAEASWELNQGKGVIP